MTSRTVSRQTPRQAQGNAYTLTYDADREAPLWGNRLVSVSGAASASLVYAGGGKQVSAMNTTWGKMEL